jgi:hypothetical protein
MIRVTRTCIIMHDSFRCVKEVGRLIRLKTRVPVEGWGSVHWRLVLRFVNALTYSTRAARKSYSLCIRAWLQPCHKDAVSLQGFSPCSLSQRLKPFFLESWFG